MCVFAQFEEKEFEVPLYFEMISKSGKVWPPGQVLEHTFGFDIALHTINHNLWRILGFPHFLPGVILNDYSWDFAWRKINKRPLPTFATNLFIQAKRPQELKHLKNNLKIHYQSLTNKKFGSPYWRFSIEAEQQKMLEKVSEKIKNRALIIYASPSFSKSSTLFQYIEQEKLIDNCSFPKAIHLKNHKQWNYDQPGTLGLAASEPEIIDEKSLFDQINILSQDSGVEPDTRDRIRANNNITELANNIIDAAKEEAFNKFERSWMFLEKVKEFKESYDSNHEYKNAFIAYSIILYFCKYYNLMWFVVGGADQHES